MVLILLEKKICSEIVKIPHVKEGPVMVLWVRNLENKRVYICMICDAQA